MTITKQVEWSYPTSPNADRFKFKTGCWTVETVEGHNPPVARAAFATREEAMQNADTMPYAWNPLFLQFNPI